jgi:hypothetical protein
MTLVQSMCICLSVRVVKNQVAEQHVPSIPASAAPRLPNVDVEPGENRLKDGLERADCDRGLRSILYLW